MILLENFLSSEPPRTVDDVELRLESIADEAGFDGFAYVGGKTLTTVTRGHALWREPPVMMMTLPSEWLSIYHEKDYARIDPVIEATLNQRLPISWDIETVAHSNDREQQRFLRDAHDFGVCRGLSIPLYGAMGDFGLMTFVSRENPSQVQKAIRRYKHDLHVTAIHLDQYIRRITTVPSRPVALTEREIEVLCWTAAGKTSSETAIILSISKKTVDFHLYNAMRKLDVYTKAQAVAKAMVSGLINP